MAGHVATAMFMYENKPDVFYGLETNSFVSVPPESTGFKELSSSEWGELIYHFTQRYLREEDLVEGVKTGTRQFLWDENGQFLTTHLE